VNVNSVLAFFVQNAVSSMVYVHEGSLEDLWLSPRDHQGIARGETPLSGLPVAPGQAGSLGGRLDPCQEGRRRGELGVVRALSPEEIEAAGKGQAG